MTRGKSQVKGMLHAKGMLYAKGLVHAACCLPCWSHCDMAPLRHGPIATWPHATWPHCDMAPLRHGPMVTLPAWCMLLPVYNPVMYTQDRALGGGGPDVHPGPSTGGRGPDCCLSGLGGGCLSSATEDQNGPEAEPDAPNDPEVPSLMPCAMSRVTAAVRWPAPT